MTTLTMAKAINAGLRKALAGDDRVVLMGEDIGTLGGVYRVTDGLQTEFGPRRVMDSPLAESGILGTAVGMAYRGYRPVVEIQFDGFIYPAFDQIVSQVARMHYRTRGAVKMPITIRVPFAGGIGAKAVVRVDHASVAASLGRWRAIDRCGAPRSVQEGPLTTEITNCEAGTDVMLVAVEGAGHQWPGAKPAPAAAARLLALDPPSPALDATGALWLFFQAHRASSPRPSGGR